MKKPIVSTKSNVVNTNTFIRKQYSHNNKTLFKKKNLKTIILFFLNYYLFTVSLHLKDDII